VTGELKFARLPARAAGMDLTATDWSVLHAICLHADRDGKAFPSMARIASLCRIERRHVARSINRLENLRLLRRERVRRGNGWANNEYKILFDEPAAGVFPQLGTGVPCAGNTCVPSDGALTDHSTDHRTVSYQGSGVLSVVEGIGKRGGAGWPRNGSD
jgi:helix-turn-helix protein